MNSSLGHILLIANPAAQSGAGAAAADKAAANLRAALGEDAVTVVRTAGPRHACAIAEGAQSAQTVVALGGDGLIHEVVNGLMTRPAGDRPQLGVIPVGSSNDYARTLGVPAKVDRACGLLLSASPQPADIGCVNGSFFAETLSFGLDAAIALDTMERRKRTGRHGAALYMASGFDQLFHHLDQREYRLQLDDGPVMEGKSITFAVQMGPYYGGGFRICPDARFDDGMLDVCVAHAPVNALKAGFVFLCAKGGRHRRFREIESLRAREIRLRFGFAPPAQIDGEPLDAVEYAVSIEPAALRVVAPSGSAFSR